LTFESGCSYRRADHGDDLGDPEAPEVGVLQRAGVGHRALEGSGQAHPCIPLNVVTQSKKSGDSRPDTGPDAALDLVESRSTPKGITIQVYRPTGRPQYETATPTPST